MKLDDLNHPGIKSLAATIVFIVTSVVCITLIARNNVISEGVTLFASSFFAVILAFAGVQGWERIQKRKTEWEPSQEVKDQIQMARMLKPPDGPVVKPFVPVDDGPTVPAGAGAKPRDLAVVAGMEAIAAKQRESIANPPTEASD